MGICLCDVIYTYSEKRGAVYRQIQEFGFGLFFFFFRFKGFLIEVIEGGPGLEAVTLKFLMFPLYNYTDLVSGLKSSYLFSASLKSRVPCAVSIKVNVLSIKGVKHESEKINSL